MNYEAGYYLIIKWIMIIFTILSIGLVGFIYVKRAIKRDIKLIWFWLSSMSLIGTMTSFIQLVKPITDSEVYAMLPERNILLLFMFCSFFIITNALWIIGVFSIAKNSPAAENKKTKNDV
jgi:hypothetical protein